MGFDRVFRNEELTSDLAVAEPASDQSKDFELAGGDAEALLPGHVWGERSNRLGHWNGCGDDDFFDNDGLPPGRDAETQPDAEGGKEDCDQRAIQLDRVFDDDETVLGV